MPKPPKLPKATTPPQVAKPSNPPETSAMEQHLFTPTTGRFLWNEPAQLKALYKPFSIEGLKQEAAKSVGAKACTSITKVAESRTMRLFRLVMKGRADGGTTVWAKIPILSASTKDGAAGARKVAAEVAAMDFARTVLRLPVPVVFAWDGGTKNPVKSQFIIMEEPAGTRASDVWKHMEVDQKLRVVDAIVHVERRLLSLSFTSYGSLFFAEDSFLGCEKPEIEGNVCKSLRKRIRKLFVVGPVAHEAFWYKERAVLNIDRGPWKQPQDYLKGICRRELIWLQQHATPSKTNAADLFPKSEAQNSKKAHIGLYKSFLKVADHLSPRDEGLNRPSFWHRGLHLDNIFIDKNNNISAILDWEDAWIGPLWTQALYPKPVEYSFAPTLELPSHYAKIQDEAERARLRTQFEKSILRMAYEKSTEVLNPALHEIYKLHQGDLKLRYLLRFMDNSWEGDIVPFRECLIRIEEHWPTLHPDTRCPIHFTPAEKQAHLLDGEAWNDDQDFWDALDGLVQRDGWVSNANYERAMEFFAWLKQEGLKKCKGKERELWDKLMNWAATPTVEKCAANDTSTKMDVNNSFGANADNGEGKDNKNGANSVAGDDGEKGLVRKFNDADESEDTGPVDNEDQSDKMDVD